MDREDSKSFLEPTGFDWGILWVTLGIYWIAWILWDRPGCRTKEKIKELRRKVRERKKRIRNKNK